MRKIYPCVLLLLISCCGSSTVGDNPARAAAADVVHLMGYDFHDLDGHLGPLAPLGWIDDTFKFAASTGRADRFILGIPNYAIGSGYWTSTRDTLKQCTSSVIGETNHMASCPFGSFAAGRAPHCNTASHGELWFDDLASMEGKMKLVQKYGARGITYWTIGEELDGYFTLLRRYFP